MRNQIKFTALLFAGIFMLQSCVNLQHVQDYTNSSIKTLSAYESIDYSFTKHCTDRCLFDAVRRNIIVRENDCNCQLYIKADSVTFLMYNALNAYFGALGNLADDKVTSYNFAPLQTALTESYIPVSGKMIEITKDQVLSYSKIGSILLKATTDAYRKKKIRDFIDEGNEPVKILLAAFQKILSENLSGVLNFKKERLYAFYFEIVLDSTSSIYERRNATLEFYEKTAEVNSKQKQLEDLAKCLQKVAEGHDKLTKSNLSVTELKETITPITTDIQALLSEINKLKNS